LEQGQVSRPRFLPELADVLETSVQWLLTGEGEAAKPARPVKDIDVALLRDVMLAVDGVIAERKLEFNVQQRAKLFSSIYELMNDLEERTPKKLGEAVNTIISYDLLQRKL
jgi:hypothetical protein